MAPRLVYRYKKSEFLKGMEEVLKPMQVAAKGAVTEAGQMVVREGGQNIASAGFSSRWSRGLRSRVTPRKPSIDCVATVTHRLGIAGVFEHGGQIRGKPLLWLPIQANLPKGRVRWTPRRFSERYGKLASVNRGGRPLLVGKVGQESVPVFVGVESVTIRKRFDVSGVADRVVARLSELYAKYLKV